MDEYGVVDESDLRASMQGCLRAGLRDFEVVGALHSTIVRATATDPVSEQEITMMVLRLSGSLEERFTFAEVPAGRQLCTDFWESAAPGTSFADLLDCVCKGDPDFWRNALKALLQFYEVTTQVIRGTLEATAEGLGRSIQEECNEAEPAPPKSVPEADQEFKALTTVCKELAARVDWISIDAEAHGAVNVSCGMRPGQDTQFEIEIKDLGDDYGSFMYLTGPDHMREHVGQDDLLGHLDDPSDRVTARLASEKIAAVQSATRTLINIQREKFLRSMSTDRSDLLLEAFLGFPEGAEKLAHFDATLSARLEEELGGTMSRIDRFLAGVYSRKEALGP